MKLHIESIEGGIYLASIFENDEYKLVRNKSNEPISFHCLNEIKQHFSKTTFEQVWLKQNTPYDEMCGLSVDNEKLELLIDWH
ncbi:DUF6482 family protein [Paraglaciecola sp. 25GB23A]|uniref:DUF6482 family protein n=1 Tax=Paraglaciecola sp. 25GB23A TaxID=3156068 RepID=UPI0032AEBABC